MTPRILASAALACGLLAASQGGAQAAIACDGNYQIVDGRPVGSLYCREMNLARIARSRGWPVTDEAIRYSETWKAQACRAIGFDNRVQEICGPYVSDGMSSHF